jgi:integrase
MSSVFARGGIYYAKVRASSGHWIARTCETRDRVLAKRMGHMLDELGHRGKQRRDLVDAVVTGRLAIADLFEAYASNSLDQLQQRMSDIDLSPLVNAWLGSLQGRLASDTIQHYRVHVRSLIPEDEVFLRSGLTFEKLAAWLSTVRRASGTRRKYHAAMAGFCAYLKSRGIIQQNPMQDVRAPRAGSPRLRYLEHDEVLRIVNALEEPYRTIVAVIHGTGIEVSVVLGLKRRDVDIDRAEIRARGTKTKARDRVTSIEPWALDLLREHVSGFLPNAPLFPGINRWTASDTHRRICSQLEIEDYQLRDSRHTYAVRAIRSGAPFEVVAQQLGHTDTTMVARVYGRFRPTSEELRAWHAVAAAQDARVAK